jgi:hypothetical protein
MKKISGNSPQLRSNCSMGIEIYRVESFSNIIFKFFFQVNGEVEKKDDSGNETGADHDNGEAVDDNSGYDKTKSFFDNISCEAVERSKGKTQRTDWRQERKINSETFGYSGFNRRGK